MVLRKFSLITVCYDRLEQLLASWPSWAAQDYPFVEHVVVVAGPSDEPTKIIYNTGFNGRVVRIRNAAYYRPSYYRNAGAFLSTGEYLGFVDADIELKPSWISLCVQNMVARYDVVANGATISNYDAGGVSGTLAIQRWLFEKIHGYNENLDDAWGYEDTDLLVRAQRAGGRATGYPRELATHAAHGDEIRTRYMRSQLKPRLPKTFVQQLWTCHLDSMVHSYEANRVRRVEFPECEVFKIEGINP